MVAPDFVRFRVAVYPGAEPSKTRRFVLSDQRIPPSKDVAEAVLGYRNPNAPNQTLGTGGHGYFQATPNIAFSIANDADIIGELGSGGAFGFGESKPTTRRDKPVVHREGVESPTAATASPCVIHGVPFNLSLGRFLSHDHRLPGADRQSNSGACQDAAAQRGP